MKDAKTVAIVNSVIALLAAVALIVSLITAEKQANVNTKAIRKSAYQNCILIRGILYSFHTPQGKASARLILKYNPHLADCQKYADSLH